VKQSNSEQQRVERADVMPERPKILILDDEPDFLELYRDLLSRLPSQPHIHTATTGARALALLESEPFSLLITDLAMPTMDGFHVLALVRRRFPALRTAVLTAIADEHYRTRAYALGIDLFMEKPVAEKDVKLVTDCIESLLDRPQACSGFRGVQSKSLVDLIQLESLSQSSSVLKIINGSQEGRIWIQDGEVIDAAVEQLRGEEGFRKILSWKTGHFEILSPDPVRSRTIHTSVQGLLLDTAQAMDEAEASEQELVVNTPDRPSLGTKLGPLTHCRGVEFVITVPTHKDETFDAWGLEEPEAVGEWLCQTMDRLRSAGEILNAGPLEHALAFGAEQNLVLLPGTDLQLCAGVRRSFSRDQVKETLKELSKQWAS
jgi:CheY-like chemotaxis protein